MMLGTCLQEGATDVRRQRVAVERSQVLDFVEEYLRVIGRE